MHQLGTLIQNKAPDNSKQIEIEINKICEKSHEECTKLSLLLGKYISGTDIFTNKNDINGLSTNVLATTLKNI